MKMDNKSTSLYSNDEGTAVNRPPGNPGAEHGSSTAIPSEDYPFTHGFLDRDPETSKARSLYFKIIGGSLFLVFTYVIWGVLPIYWASIFKLYDHAHNLHGWVVVSIRSSYPLCFQSHAFGCFQDLDGGAIGQTVAQTFIGGSGPATKMTWTAAPSNLNLTTREQLEDALVNEKAWAIVASTWHSFRSRVDLTHAVLS